MKAIRRIMKREVRLFNGAYPVADILKVAAGVLAVMLIAGIG